MSRVSILFKDNKIIVTPTTVNLRRGEHLNWDVLIQQQYLKITEFKVQIYFPERTPFNFGRGSIFEIRQQSFSRSEISAGMADLLGSYKYGVKIIDPTTNEIIEDEDPYINVLP